MRSPRLFSRQAFNNCLSLTFAFLNLANDSCNDGALSASFKPTIKLSEFVFCDNDWDFILQSQ